MNLLTSSGRTIGFGIRKHAALCGAFALLSILSPSAALGATTVVPGANLTLIASAEGTPAPTFQWRKNGTAIPGATASTFAILGATSVDAGTYQVVASNSVGSATSPEEVITVGTSTSQIAPSFIAQPTSSQTIAAGSSASFSVVVAGVPTPTVQWKKDGTIITGATSTTLTLGSVTIVDAGSYTVVATNSAGTVTSSSSILNVTESLVVGTAPKITSQPTSQTVAAGASVTFTVTASGSPAPTYQWRKNGTNMSGATNSSLVLSAVSSADAASYSVIATNSAGAAASENAMLYVQSAPIFTTQPVAQAVLSGASAKFSATVSAIPGASFQWKKNDTSIAGATASVLLISSVSSTDVASYKLVATNALGATTSDEVTLVIGSPPTINSHPTDQAVTSKSNVTFAVAASGSPAVTFQWKKNGTSISGATRETFTLKSVNKSDSGEYTVEVRNAIGWTVSNRAKLTVTTQSGRNSAGEDDPTIAGADAESPTGLVNLSVRANAGTGSNGLIVGFVIDGESSKSVLIRGVGPSLDAFGVTGALRDPQLALYSGATMAASNDDWSLNENVTQIVGASARVGAFGLVDQASDSALMATLANGAYTVQLTGKESSTGVALVEVYDATSNRDTQLVNLSVRTYIAAGADAPNVGFVIAGPTPRRLLIRAVGPTLGGFGVTDAISDPQLELYRGSVLIQQNDNWGGSASLGETFAKVGAFGFGETSSKDSVLVTTLEPGAYTVVVSGVNGAKGIGLVEVYDAP
jgi:hypothetical protein